MIDRVAAALKKHNIKLDGSNVMVCVSGGADSMALLHFMHRHGVDLGAGSVYACHFNHGLRGEESDAEQALVEAYCGQNGIDLVVGHGHMLEREKPKGEGTESWARALRYAFFEQSLKDERDFIATAHSRDDQAETLLFNLVRGSGLKGARGIAARRGNMIRPFLDISREEIERYCKENDVPYAIDSSNLTDCYSRNKIRHHAMPALREVNAGAEKNLAAFCERAAQVYDYVEQQAEQLLEKSAAGDGVYYCEPFVAGPDVATETALALLLGRFGLDPSAVLIERVKQAVAQKTRRLQLGGDVFFECEHGAFSLRRVDRDYVYDVEFDFGRLRLNNAFCISVEQLTEPPAQNGPKSSNSVYINSIDCDKIIGNLHFRSRRTGDEFRSFARKNTKSLKKLMNELAVPRKLRLRYPILVDDAGVVWLPGEGVCERAAISEHTVRAVYIQISEGE